MLAPLDSARLRNERVEELHVLAGLGMPEHAESEAPLRILERLDRAVVGPRRLAEPLADAAEALVVCDFTGARSPSTEPRRDAVVDLHGVLREGP